MDRGPETNSATDLLKTGFHYVHLGFTDATAFSPTDVMPLARWTKFVMTVQAVSLYRKLGASSQSQGVVRAREPGMLVG